MAMHRIDRDQIDRGRETDVLEEQIEDLRKQLRGTSGETREAVRAMIESRTNRLREIK